jgi:hypothetical protein
MIKNFFIILILVFSTNGYCKFELNNHFKLQSKNNFSFKPFFSSPYKEQGAIKVRVRSKISFLSKYFEVDLTPQYNTIYKSFGNINVSQSEINKDQFILHQGELRIKAGDLTLAIGKKEISVLEGALVGTAAWTHWNRSYLSTSLNYTKGFFSAQIDYLESRKDNRLLILNLGDDYKLIDAELKWHPKWIDSITLATLMTIDNTEKLAYLGLILHNQMYMYNLSFKSIYQSKEASNIKSTDYVLEGKLEFEWGEKVDHALNIGLGITSKTFNPLTGTGISLQGHMLNYFGGTNIINYSASYIKRFSDKFKIGILANYFQRADNAELIINQLNRGYFVGQDSFTLNNNLGLEVGLLAELKIFKDVGLFSGGISLFSPGDYFQGSQVTTMNHFAWFDLNLFF